MGGRMENLPILQDFVPYRGRCPASIKITEKKTKGKTVEQGQGTADHLMPLGDWFTLYIFIFLSLLLVLSLFLSFGQRTQRGRCPIGQRGEFSVRPNVRTNERANVRPDVP